MSNGIRHAILRFKFGCYFMFLLIFLFSSGTCAAQQDLLGSVKPLPFSEGQDRRYGFVSDTFHASIRDVFRKAAYGF